MLFQLGGLDMHSGGVGLHALSRVLRHCAAAKLPAFDIWAGQYIRY